jgi:hypothetical protein
MIKAATTLRRKLLLAGVLEWSFLALAVLPTLVVLLRLVYLASRSPNSWGEAIGLGIVIHFCWPVPFFALLGFVLALEWKQGLRERLQTEEGDEKHVA